MYQYKNCNQPFGTELDPINDSSKLIVQSITFLSFSLYLIEYIFISDLHFVAAIFFDTLKNLTVLEIVLNLKLFKLKYCEIRNVCMIL